MITYYYNRPFEACPPFVNICMAALTIIKKVYDNTKYIINVQNQNNTQELETVDQSFDVDNDRELNTTKFI